MVKKVLQITIDRVPTQILKVKCHFRDSRVLLLQVVCMNTFLKVWRSLNKKMKEQKAKLTVLMFQTWLLFIFAANVLKLKEVL